MPTSVSSSMARARAAASSMFRWMVSGSMICSPILQHRIERGHRLLEDHGDLPAADAAHLLLGQLQQLLAAVEADRALGMRAVPGGSSRITASAETDLPEPDSPTMATISPGWTE